MEVVSVICNISESWGASLTASNRCVVKVQVDAVQLARWTDGVGPAGLARTRRTFVVSLAAAGPLFLAAPRGVARRERVKRQQARLCPRMCIASEETAEETSHANGLTRSEEPHGH